MKDIFGIDLGTTNSCIAIIGEDGLPQVMKNLDDEFTTPSVVFYDDNNEPFVGKEAKSGMESNPERTVAFIKREMSNHKYKRKIGNITISPIEISALILKKVVDDANDQRENEGLEKINKAVITVPAYFGYDERELTKQAGQIAGLEVLDLLNEPTAAALSYGLKGLENKTVLIYDLGGGTFDVSIIRIENGVLNTLSTDGDQHLGGVDWDIKLLDWVLGQNGLDVTYEDIQHERDAGKMLLMAEACKKNLSKNEKSTFKFVYKRRQYFKEVSRSVFEELTSELLENSIDLVHHAIKISREPNVKIDEIILVGGSSYMPKVKKRLQEEFSCPIRLDHLEPDRAIAKGAALRANQLNGDTETKVKIGNDMSSRSYGIRCLTEKQEVVVQNIIRRTDDMIFEGTHEFSTSFEGSTECTVAIYENISIDSEVSLLKSTLMQEKILSWGFPVPQGTSVTAYVSRKKDGIVNVWVECEKAQVEFNIKPETLLSDTTVEALRKEMATMRV